MKDAGAARTLVTRATFAIAEAGVRSDLRLRNSCGPVSLYLFHLPGRDHRRIGSAAV
jgi:hypothetical protein